MDTKELHDVDTVYEVNDNMFAIGYDKAGQKYIGIAAGLDKNGAYIDALAALGFVLS